jgi:hypothetical protein
MPIISRFLGIAIMMYWNDHNPPHFHAKYGDYEIVISIEGNIIDGNFPKRALNLVLEWVKLHRVELVENWQMAREGRQLKQIAPLE